MNVTSAIGTSKIRVSFFVMRSKTSSRVPFARTEALSVGLNRLDTDAAHTEEV
jgi:hypothetical protein